MVDENFVTRGSQETYPIFPLVTDVLYLPLQRSQGLHRVITAVRTGTRPYFCNAGHHLPSNQGLKCIEEIILNLILHRTRILINCAPRIYIFFIQWIEARYQLNKKDIRQKSKGLRNKEHLEIMDDSHKRGLASLFLSAMSFTEQSFNFNKVQLIHYFFINHAFGAISK